MGGEVRNETKEAMATCTDPVDWIRYDLQDSIDGLSGLKQVMETAKDDVTTYDLLKDYYKDEEDIYWSQQQLDLIEKIGLSDWYTTIL